MRGGLSGGTGREVKEGGGGGMRGRQAPKVLDVWTSALDFLG